MIARIRLPLVNRDGLPENFWFEVVGSEVDNKALDCNGRLTKNIVLCELEPSGCEWCDNCKLEQCDNTALCPKCRRDQLEQEMEVAKKQIEEMNEKLSKSWPVINCSDKDPISGKKVCNDKRRFYPGI